MARPDCDAKRCCFCVDLRKGCMMCAIATIGLNVICILFNFSLWNFVIVSFAVLASVNLYNGARMYQPRMIRPFVTYSTLMGAFNLFFASYYAMSAETYCTSYYTDSDVDLCNTLMWSFYIPYCAVNAFYQLYFAYMAHSFYTQLLRGDIRRPAHLQTSGAELSDATTAAALAATNIRQRSSRTEAVVVMAEPVQDQMQYQTAVAIIQGIPVDDKDTPATYMCETVTSSSDTRSNTVNVVSDEQQVLDTQPTSFEMTETIVVGPGDVTSVNSTSNNETTQQQQQTEERGNNEEQQRYTVQPAIETYL